MNDMARMVRRFALGESESLGIHDVVQVLRLISQRPETTTVLIRLLTYGRLFPWDGMWLRDIRTHGPTNTKKDENGSEVRRQQVRGCISPSSIISPSSPPPAGDGEPCLDAAPVASYPRQLVSGKVSYRVMSQ